MPVQTARLLALALDPEVEPVADAISERILDAALELATASGIRNLTMDDVSQRAAVGRMTVYRRFGSKAAVLDALAIRECRRCLEAISSGLHPTQPAAERLAALFVATMKVIRQHPLLARLARVEPEALLKELTRDGSAIFRMVTAFLLSVIDAGQLSAVDPAVAAEICVRLGASFVLMPDSVIPLDDEHAAYEVAHALVAPLVVS
jgi:AcrR family transcriptional regulator